MDQPDSLLLEFTLHGPQLRTLLCVQRALVRSDIDRTPKGEIRSKKTEWVQAWTANVAALDEQNPGVIRDDLAKHYCYKMGSDPASRLQCYLIVLEVATFKPYFPLSGQEPQRFSNLTWHDEKETVKDILSFATALELPTECVKRLKDAMNAAITGLSGGYWKIALWSIVGAVLIAITGGLAAPAIGGVIGSLMGLGGAAAVSAGLAFLGGGALAVGGFGMAGGTALIIGGGALIGAGSFASIAKLTSYSSEFMLIQTAKLEVVLKEIVIGELKDPAKGREIIKAQRRNIAEMEIALDDLRHGKEANKDEIKNLEKGIEYMTTFFSRNKDIAKSGTDTAASTTTAPQVSPATQSNETTLTTSEDWIIQNAEPSVPEQIGPYPVLRKLGAGGMAEVYLVRDGTLFRDIALKVMHETFFKGATDRAQREINTLSRLRHDNIVQMFDEGTWEGRTYFTMQYVDGMSLAELVSIGKSKQVASPAVKCSVRDLMAPLQKDDFKSWAAGPMKDISLESPSYIGAIRIVQQILLALNYIHAQEIVHRDVKPSNVLLEPNGHALLSDFGIARIPLASGTEALTAKGEFIGTMAYASPEQLCDKHVDGRSDIYSVGAVLYELVCGVHVFNDFVSPNALIAAAISQQPKAPISIVREIPNRLNEIILKALAKDPNQRFQTGFEFRQALNDCCKQSVNAQ